MELPLRKTLRKFDQLREIEIIPNYMKNADGSCLIKFGNTHVICTASIDENVPRFLKRTGMGWITAEYGMLPRSTNSRMDRESVKGRQDGRTQEIQRLIGRSLRCVVMRKFLGERQIIIDCDVIQADGGTRTASITGGYVALSIAINKLLKSKLISKMPLTSQVAGISCGIVNGNAMLDLDYEEDSSAETDANFVMANSGIIEIQATGESKPFSNEEFQKMYALAEAGIKHLFALQLDAIKKAI